MESVGPLIATELIDSSSSIENGASPNGNDDFTGETVSVPLNAKISPRTTACSWLMSIANLKVSIENEAERSRAFSSKSRQNEGVSP
jgi:hypothetical protein